MNTVAIKGYIRDIEFSHDVGEIEYDKATVVCPGVNGKEDDLFLIRFKKFCNKYKEGDLIEFKGNLRSYSIKDGDKSNVQIYIFTYFDLPDIICGDVNIDGRICKIDELRTTKSGKNYIHFILANNIFTTSFLSEGIGIGSIDSPELMQTYGGHFITYSTLLSYLYMPYQ